MTKLSHLISFIFHPMLFCIGIFGFLIFSQDVIHPAASWNFLTVILFLSILPIATLLILLKYNWVSDMVVSDKTERLIPLRFAVIFALIAFVILSYVQAEPIIRGLTFVFVTNTGVILIITRYWKISIHAMSTAGLMTALWLYGIHMPALMVVAIFAVSAARIHLNAHSFHQILVGNILGVLLTYFQLTRFFIYI